MPIKIFLVICYGNIARSRMAEGYLKKMITKHNLQIEVLSAGLNAQGRPPTKETIDIMKREQIKISNHNSIQLTLELLDKANLILTMEKVHKKAILCIYKQFKNKIFTLKEFAGETKDLDIKDPYGQRIAYYENCAREIKSNLIKSFRKMLKFVGV